jgi:hypothetical protein
MKKQRSQREVVGQRQRGGRRRENYTDKKENQIFLICKEIQKGSDAKSYMTDGLLIYG